MKDQNSREELILVNRQIRAPRVRCKDETGAFLGNISFTEALNKASNAGLDLVQISPGQRGEPPMCQILDGGKYKYEESKRKKEIERKLRESQIHIKEVQFRPNTAENDLRTKAKQAEQFIADGCKVRVVIKFTGREHQSVGMETLQRFVEMIDNAALEGEPESERREIRITLVAKKAEKADK